jgi:hypothetical protein
MARLLTLRTERSMPSTALEHRLAFAHSPLYLAITLAA